MILIAVILINNYSRKLQSEWLGKYAPHSLTPRCLTVLACTTQVK